MGIINYFKSTGAEMKHVSWPTRRQTTVFTILVVIISLFIAAYIGLFDELFTLVVKSITEAI